MVANTIPASDIVKVDPAVLNAGGSALQLLGILLTTSTRVPIGDVHEFFDAASVGTYFGLASDEYQKAGVYFLGFDNSTVKPAGVYFAQYPLSAVAAYMRGGNISGLTLNALKAITGTLTIPINGYSYVISAIDLSAATSFSSAATIITTALAALIPVGAAFTGVLSVPPSGIPTLTVSAVASGTLLIGGRVVGASVPANCYIIAQLTGTTGGTGTYQVSQGAAVSSESMTLVSAAPVVTYDSTSGAFVVTSGNTGLGSTLAFATGTAADPLLLTQAKGAVLSQGAAAGVPGTFMDGIVAQTQNWATFTYLFDPDGGSGNTQKLAFATWTNAQNKRYGFAAPDADVSPSTTVPAVTSLGYLLQQSLLSGTAPIWEPGFNKGVFLCGMTASIDWLSPNGRITAKFKGQAGLTPTVTNLSVANNLRLNGYNFYGVWATANQQFQGWAEGTVSGSFQWWDTYVNQIWLNNALQLALMNLLFNVNSIPYNTPGYQLVDAACADPINAALLNGVIRAGVTLSALQIASINNTAGAQIAGDIQNQGWYLQILDAAQQTRQARLTPPCKLWYTDGESIHFIELASIVVQ